jgi:hypothetical protein
MKLLCCDCRVWQKSEREFTEITYDCNTDFIAFIHKVLRNAIKYEHVIPSGARNDTEFLAYARNDTDFILPRIPDYSMDTMR